MALAQRVKRARTDMKISQEELARQARVSTGTVRSLESGRSVDPSFFTVIALARVLQLGIADLVGDL